jgi:hypothetical protein
LRGFACDGSHLYFATGGGLLKIDPKTGKSVAANKSVYCLAGTDVVWDGQRLWLLHFTAQGLGLRQLDPRTMESKPGQEIAIPAEVCPKGSSRHRARLGAASGTVVLMVPGGKVFLLELGKRSWKPLPAGRAGAFFESAKACCFWGGRKWWVGARRYAEIRTLYGQALPGARAARGKHRKKVEIAVGGFCLGDEIRAIAPAGGGRFWIFSYAQNHTPPKFELILLDTGVKPLAAGPGGGERSGEADKGEGRKADPKASKQERQKEQGAEKKKKE